MALDARPAIDSPTTAPLEIALVTPWRTRCGIASHSSYLIEQLAKLGFHATVFARHENNAGNDSDRRVRRCWRNLDTAARQDLRLLLINAQYPLPESERLAASCRQFLRQAGLLTHAALLDDYLSDEESRLLLGAADVIVFPYQQTNESSNAAVRGALAG